VAEAFLTVAVTAGEVVFSAPWPLSASERAGLNWGDESEVVALNRFTLCFNSPGCGCICGFDGENVLVTCEIVVVVVVVVVGVSVRGGLALGELGGL
jgi:hypothetical protein